MSFRYAFWICALRRRANALLPVAKLCFPSGRIDNVVGPEARHVHAGSARRLLAKPQGTGPFAAIVLVHECGGFHSSMISWADRLSRFGYAALAVAMAAGDRSSIERGVYPGAHHDFDRLDLFLAPGRGISIKGHRADNEVAARDSIVRVCRKPMPGGNGGRCRD